MQDNYWNNAEGMKLFYKEWHIDNPRAVIALVHGQGEHVSRYEHMAKWYNDRGIAVFGFDQQGHGRSEGIRGHARNLAVLLDDIGLFLEKTAEKYPGIPVFLYGHSMGGGECLTYVLQRTPTLTGVVITSPLIRLAFETPHLKVLAGKILRRLVPSLTMPTGLAAHFISHDPEVVNAYKADPYVHGKVSAAAGLTLMEMGEWLDHYSGKLNIPLLLMHGSDDRITSSKASKAFAERVGGDITFREWEGLWHETHNEKEKEQVFQFTYDWMIKHLE